MNDNEEKKNYKAVQKLIKKQDKAQKVYSKNTNKVAKDILKKNEKKGNGC